MRVKKESNGSQIDQKSSLSLSLSLQMFPYKYPLHPLFILTLCQGQARTKFSLPHSLNTSPIVCFSHRFFHSTEKWLQTKAWCS